MKIFDDLASVLFEVIMSHGSSEGGVKKLEKALETLELKLKESQTNYFLSSKHYTMVDLYGFPHASRIFYCKDSAMNKLFVQLKVEEKYPNL